MKALSWYIDIIKRVFDFNGFMPLALAWAPKGDGEV
jgi:hypothetical protein